MTKQNIIDWKRIAGGTKNISRNYRVLIDFLLNIQLATARKETIKECIEFLKKYNMPFESSATLGYMRAMSKLSLLLNEHSNEKKEL